jgi:hypothetical protein
MQIIQAFDGALIEEIPTDLEADIADMLARGNALPE